MLISRKKFTKIFAQTTVEYALATAFVFALAMMFYVLFERPTSNMSVMELMFERVEYSVIKPNP